MLNEHLDGEHGYYNDIPSMYPFFMAHGPSFKKNHKTNSFYNVDIYPLMCYILGIEGQPNNGSLSRVVDLLQLRIVDDNFGLGKFKKQSKIKKFTSISDHFKS